MSPRVIDLRLMNSKALQIQSIRRIELYCKASLLAYGCSRMYGCSAESEKSSVLKTKLELVFIEVRQRLRTLATVRHTMIRRNTLGRRRNNSNSCAFTNEET